MRGAKWIVLEASRGWEEEIDGCVGIEMKGRKPRQDTDCLQWLIRDREVKGTPGRV